MLLLIPSYSSSKILRQRSKERRGSNITGARRCAFDTLRTLGFQRGLCTRALRRKRIDFSTRELLKRTDGGAPDQSTKHGNGQHEHQPHTTSDGQSFVPSLERNHFALARKLNCLLPRSTSVLPYKCSSCKRTYEDNCERTYMCSTCAH